MDRRVARCAPRRVARDPARAVRLLPADGRAEPRADAGVRLGLAAGVPRPRRIDPQRRSRCRARLLLVSLAAQWLFAQLPLSLLVRQFLPARDHRGRDRRAHLARSSSLNGAAERYFARRVPPARTSAAASLLRVGRRILDVVIVLGGMLVMLRHFGVDPTPVLAGLGVGGIAVALAAQKTLENVIAGASLIVDQAVRVGDFLKIGRDRGNRRSHRFALDADPHARPLDRQRPQQPDREHEPRNAVGARQVLVSPRRRAALRDDQTIRCGWCSTASGRRSSARPRSIAPVIRVRFLHLGAFSLDVEVFAYVLARDWAHFLEIQEALLLRITDIVQASGPSIAFPPRRCTCRSQLHNDPTPNAQLTPKLQFPKLPEGTLTSWELGVAVGRWELGVGT